MESPAQPTFIPHGAVTSAPMNEKQSGGLSELVFLLSILILIISAALGAGVFLYTQYLQTSNASKLNQLNTAQAAFDPSLVEQLTRLDSRMRAGQQLLASHLAPSLFFNMLEQSTIQDISFSSLTLDATDPQHIALSMAGIAGSVNSIALQAQVFAQSGVIASPIFSNINQEADGVHFDFTALINPSAISYEHLVSGQAQSQSTTLPQSGTLPQAQQTQSPAQPQSPSQPASPFQSSGSATSSGSGAK